MPKRTVPRGRPFQKGNPGGPGRPAIRRDVRLIQQKFGQDFTVALNEIGQLPLKEIQRKATDLSQPGMHALAARWWARALNGSMPHAEAIVSRLGSVAPKALELSGPEGTPLFPQLAEFSPDQVTAAILGLKRMIKEVTPCNSTPTSPHSSALPAPQSPTLSDKES